MSPETAALLGDGDQDFRESLVNHLLLAGVETLVEVESAGEVARMIRRIPFSLLIIDYDLYREADVRASLRRLRRVRGPTVLVTLDEDRLTREWQAIQAEDVPFCVVKSETRKVLAALLGGE